MPRFIGVRQYREKLRLMAIARAVIVLGNSMQLSVIAEGVETEQQQDFLRAEGCDEGQGYFYSRPVSAADFFSAWHKQSSHA